MEKTMAKTKVLRKRRWSRGRRARFEETIKTRKARRKMEERELALGYMAVQGNKKKRAARHMRELGDHYIAHAKTLDAMAEPEPPAPESPPVPTAFKCQNDGTIYFVDAEGDRLRRLRLQTVRLFVADPGNL